MFKFRRMSGYKATRLQTTPTFRLNFKVPFTDAKRIFNDEIRSRSQIESTNDINKGLRHRAIFGDSVTLF